MTTKNQTGFMFEFTDEEIKPIIRGLDKLEGKKVTRGSMVTAYRLTSNLMLLLQGRGKTYKNYNDQEKYAVAYTKRVYNYLQSKV